MKIKPRNEDRFKKQYERQERINLTDNKVLEQEQAKKNTKIESIKNHCQRTFSQFIYGEPKNIIKQLALSN